MTNFQIEDAVNGFVVENEFGEKRIFKTIEEAFTYIYKVFSFPIVLDVEVSIIRPIRLMPREM